jgi:predicted kinase
VGLPTLAVISGPPGGYGKTTLAHALARTVGCPAICRDEIKEGMVHAHPGFEATPSDELTMRTFPTFFSVLDLLLRAECSVVAEAAFQDHLWRPKLEPLAELSRIRIIRCTVSDDVARERNAIRYADNPIRRAHADTALAGTPSGATSWVPISLDVPTLTVDTSDGYRPGLGEIAAFVNG